MGKKIDLNKKREEQPVVRTHRISYQIDTTYELETEDNTSQQEINHNDGNNNNAPLNNSGLPSNQNNNNQNNNNNNAQEKNQTPGDSSKSPEQKNSQPNEENNRRPEQKDNDKNKENKNKLAKNLSDKIAYKIKQFFQNPVTINAIMFVIPILILIFIVMYILVAIYGSEYFEGNYALNGDCPTVTVIDTGCDSYGKNCTHQYDGNVSFEDYIAGVVAAEVGSANNLEYFKVAAIAARTYFLKHVGNSCTVKGNATFQAYIDVEDSGYSELIKQAVEETTSLVMIKTDELADAYYASACVVNADDEYYYVRYGSISLGEPHIQQIPKEWDQVAPFQGYLAGWYADVDQSSTDYENKSCPNNHDYGMSQLGALYLITGENYDYQDVIEYYYGNDIEIKQATFSQSTTVNGFINPTRYINCSSAYGNRIHPVKGTISFHSGLDIGIPGGEPIYAAKSGTVTYVRSNVNAINNCDYGYGNYIQIDHGDGTSTLYSHIKYGTIPDSIYIGAEVSQGKQIGQIGSTGCSTGNHLHYEVRVNGNTVDPADYLDLTGATGTCRR